MTNPRLALEHRHRLARGALVLGVVGLLFWILGMVVDPRQAAMSYLVAYTAALTTVLGALILVMMSHATGAKWFVVLRRITEVVAATLPVLLLLFIPILVGLHDLYPWLAPHTLAASARERVLRKHAYLNLPFFLVRAGAYFATWIVLAWLLRRWSVRQDRTGDVQLTLRQRRLSAGGLVAIAITLTFASFDWLMSLSPTWYSTIYGIYIFAGGFVGALALIAVVARVSERTGTLAGLVHDEQYHALGKLQLTFVIFWAYIAFAQLLIIWIGDIPLEITWYLSRMRGSWGALGVVLAIGNFAIPFVLLLSRRLKQSGPALARLSVWLLIMHYVDVYWLVMPELHPGSAAPHWLDLAAIAAVTGLTTAYGAWRLRASAAVPMKDPYLEASLRYGDV